MGVGTKYLFKPYGKINVMGDYVEDIVVNRNDYPCKVRVNGDLVFERHRDFKGGDLIAQGNDLGRHTGICLQCGDYQTERHTGTDSGIKYDSTYHRKGCTKKDSYGRPCQGYYQSYHSSKKLTGNYTPSQHEVKCGICEGTGGEKHNIATSGQYYDNNYHSKPCLTKGCGYPGVLVGHTPKYTAGSGNSTGHSNTCSECNYSYTKSHNHNGAGSYTGDENYHYRACSVCGYVDTNKNTCVKSKHNEVLKGVSDQNYHYSKCKTCGSSAYVFKEEHKPKDKGYAISSKVVQTSPAVVIDPANFYHYSDCKICGYPMAFQQKHSGCTYSKYNTDLHYVKCKICGTSLQGHDYVAKGNKSYHWIECDQCSQVDAKKHHNYPDTLALIKNSSEKKYCTSCSAEVASSLICGQELTITKGGAQINNRNIFFRYSGNKLQVKIKEPLVLLAISSDKPSGGNYYLKNGGWTANDRYGTVNGGKYYYKRHFSLDLSGALSSNPKTSKGYYPVSDFHLVGYDEKDKKEYSGFSMKIPNSYKLYYSTDGSTKDAQAKAFQSVGEKELHFYFSDKRMHVEIEIRGYTKNNTLIDGKYINYMILVPDNSGHSCSEEISFRGKIITGHGLKFTSSANWIKPLYPGQR